jgi:cholest-4-en-3-one 26-monooxygenase
MTLTLDDIDLLADTWAKAVPHDQFELLRREAPVFWHEEPDDTGFWAITRWDDIVAISRDHATFSTEQGGTFIPTQPEADLELMRLSILNMDPPKHDRFRKLVSAGFTPRMIRRLIEQVNEHATHIVDGIAHKGEIDYVDVSAELPIAMICEMLGIPEADWPQMRAWSDRMVGWDDPEYSTPEEGEIAAAEMFAYCDALAKAKRDNPTDDIMSALVHADVDGDRLTDIELNLFFVTLVIAGNETTRNLISHGMLCMMENPDVAEELRQHPEKMSAAVDEMLRWGSSIENFRRTATRDTEIRGVPIKKGDKVVTFYMSGNFDEEHFEDPFTFRLDRGVNDHVAFGGGGIHFCLGSHLAKAEIGAIIGETINRLPDIRLNGDVVRLRSDFINGVKHLPVAFTPDI